MRRHPTFLTHKMRCRYDDGSYDVDFMDRSMPEIKDWHKVALREDQIRAIAVEGVDAEGSGALKDDKVKTAPGRREADHARCVVLHAYPPNFFTPHTPSA